MSRTTIQRLVDMTQGAFEKLKISYELQRVEDIAILVHEAMSTHTRKFHTTSHIFDVAEETAEPHHVLASIFHDVVYFNVDNCLTERISEHISSTIALDNMKNFRIRRKIAANDRGFWLVLHVFGYKPGQDLQPFQGMNEFLSAIVAVRCLEDMLSLKDLLAVVCAIEASIPFRGVNAAGRTSFEELEVRVRKYCREKKIVIGESEIQELMKVAVHFANRDVSNFAEPETALFLNNTWKLLPENSPSLLDTTVYTVKKYRSALQKMEGFFSSINSEQIFHRYRQYPTEKEFESLKSRAKRNVALGRLYLSGRLLATAILEALGEASGGDAPVVMFLGGNSKGNLESKYEFDDMIPKVVTAAAEDLDKALIQLYEYESKVGSLLDFRKSPLAGFVYKQLGTSLMLKHVVEAKKYFNQEISAEEFLSSIPSKIVGPVAAACAAMISTRKDKLLKWSA